MEMIKIKIDGLDVTNRYTCKILHDFSINPVMERGKLIAANASDYIVTVNLESKHD